MSIALSPAEIAAYRQSGIHFPYRALPASEAATLAERYRANAATIRGRNNQKPHLLYTWLDALIRDPRILDPVESLLGPNLWCWSAQFFGKPAGDAAYVSWHQDATYWGLSSPDVVTAWVALTPSTRAAGCMQVVAHLRMMRARHDLHAAGRASAGRECHPRRDDIQ